ncbi:LysR family transcriptional regulator [Variovorax sp. JS1663]|uniref:LysR family transcriptional regulator n=1 Tax=Variovorax sp. JS1663 TaxID=1851577 RepID=UPI000B34566C|nr:LysR family transcriptional regulator [Variovorax sp. JS1663]OUL98233.1 LysR family transcriptional regulator [Variovorax sp. JS1663]
MDKSARRLVWDDLRLIRSIAEHGGLSAAAGHLGLAVSTVFRRLEQMEAVLEATLFERHRAGYALTPAGEELLALAERVDEDVTAVARRIAGQQRVQQPRGELSIATNDTLLTELLTPLFAVFSRRHPEMRLNVRVGNPSLNLARRDADIAIRATDHPPENLAGVRIARMVWAPYGKAMSPTARRRSAGASPLEEQPWVTLNDELAGHSSTRFVRTNVPAERIGYTVNTVSGLAEAIEAGIGVGYLPCVVGDTRQGLTRLGPLAPALGNNLWLLSHPDLRGVPRVRAMLDFLAAEMVKLRPLLEGERPHAPAREPGS